LKQNLTIDKPLGSGSPPARGRGLKLPVKQKNPKVLSVAPRAGAWIETGGAP